MARKNMDPISEAALETVEMERLQEESLLREQEMKERKVAECHQIIGRIQGAKIVADFANVGSLIWLKEVKDSKLYKEIKGIGSWEKFCDCVGLSRSKVDEDLLNLAAFGEKFIADVGSFSIGYRELRKLRQLAQSGDVVVETEAVLIGDERIPLDADHRDDLQAALERIIEAKDQLLEEKNATLRANERVLQAKEDVIRRQEKEIGRYEDQAAKQGLTPAEDAFLQKMEAARGGFDGYMLRVEPERMKELYNGDEEPTPRMIAAYLSTLDYMRKQLLAAWDAALYRYGSAAISPEDAWVQPPEDPSLMED